MGTTSLSLSADDVLATTRAVRRRLDLTRPVEREVLEECLTLAQQAPTGSNRQGWHFVVVTDPARRAALADLYRRGWARYTAGGARSGEQASVADARQTTQQRVADSASFLAEHLHEVPVHVIPCVEGRVEGAPVVLQASQWGSILPATWSFMLAARARGLGTAWTTLHLFHEKEAADILGIPYNSVTQAALIPVAYTKGAVFQPAPRASLETMVHWDGWPVSPIA